MQLFILNAELMQNIFKHDTHFLHTFLDLVIAKNFKDKCSSNMLISIYNYVEIFKHYNNLILFLLSNILSEISYDKYL